MRTTLRDRLGESTVFRTFTWSGRNSHSARLRAGEELRQDLEAAVTRYPDAKHFVVAHSHGGNVALYALRERRLHPWITGLVTLATPFIVCRPRELEARFRTLGVILPVMGMVVLFPLIAGLVILAGFLVGEFLPRTELVLGTIFVVELLVILGLVPVAWEQLRWLCTGVLFARAQKRQALVLTRLALPENLPVSMLCLRFAGDEPGSWLGTLHALSRLPALIAPRIQATLKLIVSLVAAFGALAIIVLVILDEETTIPGEKIYEILAYGTIGLLQVLGVLFVLMQLAMMLVPKVTRSHPLGFGPEAMLDHFVADIGVDEEPTCSPSAECRSFSPVAAARRVGLRGVLQHLRTERLIHSAIYKYEPSLLVIGDWIANR